MKRLTLTYGGKRVLSAPFNLKAYRVMCDALAGIELTPQALDAAAVDGVLALYDGTELGEVLLRGEIPSRTELLEAMGMVLNWYTGVKLNIPESRTIGTPPPRPVIALYHRIMSECGALPDEIDRQDPQLMFDVLYADMGNLTRAEDVPEECRFFMGL